MEVIKHS